MKKIGVLLVGLLFLGIGIFMYVRNNTLQKVCTKETTATVVSMEEEMESSEDGMRYIYYPVIEYNAGSKKVKTTMPSGSNPPAYSVNDKVTILYNPKKTNEFIVKGDKTTGILSYVMMGLGAIVSIAGIVVLFKKD